MEILKVDSRNYTNKCMWYYMNMTYGMFYENMPRNRFH